MSRRDDSKLIADLNRTYSPSAGGPYLSYIVLLRLFAGFTFLRMGLQKLPNLGNPAPMRAQIAAWANNQTHPFWGYQEFLKEFVLPNLHIFQVLVTFGEIAVGVALLVGGFTRLAAFFGMVMNVNYWFATGYGSPGAGLNEALVAIEIVLILAAAGRLLGLDVFLARRFPRSPFW
jgi:thiosulfate dehydrogenase [quinone] large subunit